MTETYAKSETQASRRNESDEGIRLDTDSRENAGQIARELGLSASNLIEKIARRKFPGNAIGGILTNS
jgi:hypothetical protein